MYPPNVTNLPVFFLTFPYGKSWHYTLYTTHHSQQPDSQKDCLRKQTNCIDLIYTLVHKLVHVEANNANELKLPYDKNLKIMEFNTKFKILVV